MRFHILIFLSLVLAFAACEKDSSTEVVTFTQTTLSGETVTANFYGHLTNDQGEVVANAEVRIGSRQTTTDQEGLWSIDNATVVKDQAFLQFASSNHHKGSRTLLVDEGNTYEVDVQMLAFSGAESVEAATGGVVNVPNSNAMVTFPAGAFAKTDGTPYTGTVRVETAYLDPNERSTGDRMPGDLRATTAAGDSRLLITYGMVSVELFDDAGNPLELAANQTATISMPITGEVANTAPASIPLWYFDEATAQWLEEGSATLQNGSYVGEVSHFTFWNCDIPTEYIRLCGTVVFETSDSVSSANLQLIVQSQNFGTGYGYTNENGQFCGIVPANETLTFIIQGDCPGPIYTVTIGPYSGDTDLGTIIIPVLQNYLVNLSGTASCNGDPLTSGAVRISQNGNLVGTTSVNSDGGYSTDFITCDNSEIVVSVINYATREFSDPETFAFSNVIVAGDIEACTQVLNNYFTLTIDGAVYTGDSCNFFFDNGELSLEGTGVGPTGQVFAFNFFVFDNSLPQPLVAGTYATPLNSQEASLNLLGTSPSGFFSMDGLPYTITSRGTAAIPYTTGLIGPGTVFSSDSTGVVQYQVEIDFSAFDF